jgi:hypothetical protein
MMSKIMSGLSVTWKIVWRLGLFFIAWGILMAVFFVPFGSKLALCNSQPFSVEN